MPNDKSILVVDDDPAVLEMICEGLIDNGFDVFSAMNPREALNKLRENPVMFALLDVDLGSPEMNGIGLGKQIKADYEDIIIILMTGYHNIKLAVDAMRSHAFDYMIKPFRIDQIISLMERSEREMNVRKENRKLKDRISDLENTLQKLEAKMESLMPVSSALPAKKDAGAKVHSDRAVRSYQRQK